MKIAQKNTHAEEKCEDMGGKYCTSIGYFDGALERRSSRYRVNTLQERHVDE